MDTKLLKEILDAPGGFGEIRHLCEEFEGYHDARAALNSWYKKLESILGREEFYKLEATISQCQCWENQAYYIFGLHVREDLREALML